MLSTTHRAIPKLVSFQLGLEIGDFEFTELRFVLSNESN